MVEKLEIVEERLKDAMVPFLVSIFSKFYDYKHIWQAAVSILTELDCLSSLAIVSG